MAYLLTEEQTMLKDSAKEFLKDKSPVSALRILRDTKDKNGFDVNLWKEMVDMGWAGLVIPEAYGGLDFGYVGMGQILEEAGRTLTASPLFSNSVVSATAINLSGNLLQKEKYLPQIADGSILMSLALEEGSLHRPSKIATRAQKTKDGYILSGKKIFVLDGHVADHLIVVARTAGEEKDKNGISMFIVDTKTEGVTIERTIMMDSRNAANVHFNNVKVSENALLGEANNAYMMLTIVLDVARICLSAEMLGTMQEAFDRTIAYLKEREQFGTIIGKFQSLQHRAAQMYCEIELCKSLVTKSLQAIDKQSKKLPGYASMTKAKVGETIKLVTNEAIQMYGGIGMTDEEEIGFFLKRSRVAKATFGDYSYHLNRFASLNGF